MCVAQIGEWGEAHFRSPATRDVLHGVETALGHALPRDVYDVLRETTGLKASTG